MEVVGKLIAIFLLSSSFAVGTVYVLEKGFFSSTDNEDVTVSSSISDALIKTYRKKFRDEYYELKKDDEVLKEDAEKVEKPVWKYEYDNSTYRK
ncbi:MAG: hypothetical protein ACRENO_05135 [Thermodesulfobacteriota bacterium]